MASLGEYSEYHYLEKILEDAVTHKSTSRKRTQSKSSKYDKISDFKMENYTYNYHQQKKD